MLENNEAGGGGECSSRWPSPPLFVSAVFLVWFAVAAAAFHDTTSTFLRAESGWYQDRAGGRVLEVAPDHGRRRGRNAVVPLRLLRRTQRRVGWRNANVAASALTAVLILQPPMRELVAWPFMVM